MRTSKCPTKCYLQSHGESGPSNALAEWLRVQSESYRSKGVRRLITGLTPDACAKGSIYLVETRLFMLMEVDDNFSFVKKTAVDQKNPKVREWEELMWTFEQALPGAKQGEKRLLMERIHKLES